MSRLSSLIASLALSALTLFSGAGGADMGLRDAGFTIVGAVEYDRDIAGQYAKNFGSDHLWLGDVRNVNYTRWFGVTLAWLSPPCPNFSNAKQGAKETKNDISIADSCARCIEETRPRFVILENVAGYLGSESLSRITRTLTRLGYVFEVMVRNSADYGVPQTRERLILRAVHTSVAKVVPPMVPTHCDPKRIKAGQADLFGGSLDLLPWRGWYEAVASELPNCKPSRLAAWQEERLTAKYGADWLGHILPHPNADNDWFVAPGSKDPAYCITGSLNTVKAVLVSGGSASADNVPASGPDAPAMTIKANCGTREPLGAVLVVEQYAQSNKAQERTPQTFAASSPAPTVMANHAGVSRAVLVRHQGEGSDLATPCDVPAPTLTTEANKLRVATGYTVVSLNTRAQANIQTFWPGYIFATGKGSQKLNSKLIGNAVPVRLATAAAKPFAALTERSN